MSFTFARCNGDGIIDCFCGGDLCVCGLDGDQCPGCEECEAAEREWNYEEDWVTGYLDENEGIYELG
jgi:hypothetical protein